MGAALRLRLRLRLKQLDVGSDVFFLLFFLFGSILV